MKTAKIVIALFLITCLISLLFGLFGCTTECKDCTTTVYQNNKVISTTVQNMCGDEVDRADGAVITTKQGSITIVSKTYCK